FSLPASTSSHKRRQAKRAPRFRQMGESGGELRPLTHYMKSDFHSTAAVAAGKSPPPQGIPDMPESLADAVARRRTFAIISHPDAGKTTLTEKLLLFGGAIQLAGEVKAKKNRIQTRSDWMKIERERGISVVTSVMTFEYGGHVFNLLDT